MAQYGYPDLVAVQASQLSTPIQAETTNVSYVTGSVGSIVIFYENTRRSGASLTNDSPASVFVKLGSGASSNDFTTKMSSYDYFETPFQYTGSISAVWTAATGYMRLTEYI